MEYTAGAAVAQGIAKVTMKIATVVGYNITIIHIKF